MTGTALAPQDTAALLERVLVGGDLEKLTPAQRLAFYQQVCESTGLNPLTQPLLYVRLNNKLTLYAKKDATDQLRRLHRVSVTIVDQRAELDLYVVTARATTPEGRSDEEIGVVGIAGLKGEALANAYMKAVTKAKRRVTLSVCGLGLLDETEVDSVPGARLVPVDRETGEIAVDEATERQRILDGLQKIRKYLGDHGVIAQAIEEQLEPVPDGASNAQLLAYGTAFRQRAEQAVREAGQ